MADSTSIFEQMLKKVREKQQYQKTRRLLYEGLHNAPNVRISKDKVVTAYASRSLGWPATAVDHLISDCSFDGFDRDEFAATRLLVEAGGDRAITSAMTNAAIGAVSFVAIFPRSTGYPALVTYTGAEATGIFNALGTELKYGMAVKRKESGRVVEWYLFERGAIHVLNSVGDTLDTLELGVDAMPFIEFAYDPDPAARPFGHSRLSPDSIDNLDEGLRSMGLSSMLTKINLIRNDFIFIKGSPSATKSEKHDSEAGEYNIIYLDSQEGVDAARLEKARNIDGKEISENFVRAGEQFASTMSMLPVTFGIQPANGSYSAEVLSEMQRPYFQTRDRVRMSYGDSIKRLAIELYKIVAQTDDVDGLKPVQSVFKARIDPGKIGSFGDAFQKISSSSSEMGIEVPASFWRDQMGIPIRDTVMQQPLPNLEAARRRFREVILDKV